MKRINHLALHQLVSRIYGALGLSEDKAALLSDIFGENRTKKRKEG